MVNRCPMERGVEALVIAQGGVSLLAAHLAGGTFVVGVALVETATVAVVAVTTSASMVVPTIAAVEATTSSSSGGVGGGSRASTVNKVLALLPTYKLGVELTKSDWLHVRAYGGDDRIIDRVKSGEDVGRHFFIIELLPRRCHVVGE